VQTIRELTALRAAVSALRTVGSGVALVPTMGALHAGHLALIAEARRRADAVVASIFVNPKQFGPNEDLAAYPRRELADARMLEDAGCSLLWLPTVEQMYPAGFSTNVSVAGLGDMLDGAARPGHFDGVATVVTKLLNQVGPDVALFGEKDFQQLTIIRQLVADLDLAVEVVGIPTQRDADGVALSSRNAYLSDEDRRVARMLPRALGDAARSIQRGEDVAGVLEAAVKRLQAGGFDSVDYVEFRSADTLQLMERLVGAARLLAAARIGSTRLIDNVAVEPAP
jgi:pantoate--beta-alanine ligase